MNGLNRTMRMNTEDRLDQSLMTNTDSPWLAVTPGEWYASETIRMIRTDLRQMNGFMRILGAMCDCWTVGVCPQLDSAAADCGAVELVDLIVRRTTVAEVDDNADWRNHKPHLPHHRSKPITNPEPPVSICASVAGSNLPPSPALRYTGANQMTPVHKAVRHMKQKTFCYQLPRT